MATQAQQHEADVKQLNMFLKNELSAVETYDQCIGKVENEDISSDLTALQDSHKKRAQLLSERIKDLGGVPAGSSGIWGGIAKLLQGGSKLFGEKAAISTLEEGEDQGREDYQREMNKLSPDNQRFVQEQIMPEQQHSHDALQAIEEKVKRLH